MRAVPTEMVRPGMILARTVYLDGVPYLREGVELKPTYIDHFRGIGVLSLFVKDDFPGLIEIEDMLAEGTRLAAFEAVKATMIQARTGFPLEPDACLGMAQRIIDEILNDPQVLIHLADVRALNDYTFAHSVSVCTLATLLGVHRGLNRIDLHQLAVGALLHDIGKMFIAEEIWNKQKPLTPQERARMKEHTTLGFAALRKAPGLSLLAAHIAYQHHERYDGQGYPRGLMGEEIHIFGRITAVADVYDALTTDRVYRPAWTPLQAAEHLAHGRATLFDGAVVNTFLRRVALYPVGSRVRLNTGEVGIVVHVRKEAPSKPIVKLLGRPDGDLSDLVAAAEISVTDVISDQGALPAAGGAIVTGASNRSNSQVM